MSGEMVQETLEPGLFQTGSVSLHSEPTYSNQQTFGCAAGTTMNYVIHYQVIQTDLILGTSYPPRFDLHEWIISVWNRIWNRICRVVYEWYHRKEVNLIEEELAAQKALAAVDPEFARSIQ